MDNTITRVSVEELRQLRDIESRAKDLLVKYEAWDGDPYYRYSTSPLTRDDLREVLGLPRREGT